MFLHSNVHMIYISQEVKAVYSVICAILHTGNIDFDEKETTDHKGDACVITNMDLVNTSKCTDFSMSCSTSSTLIIFVEIFIQV